MIIVHYEVYVLESRGWMLHARFSRQEREAAVAEAKELESTLKIRVKVVRESYNSDDNVFDEAEVYISGTGVGKKESRSSAPPQRVAAPKPAGKPAGKSTSSSAPRKALAAPPPRRPAAKPTGAGRVLWRMTLITLVGLAVALGALRLTPDIIVFLYDYGYRVTPESYGQLLFAVFVLTFLMVAVPLSLRYLPKNTEIRFAKPSFGWGGGRRGSNRDEELKRSLDKLAAQAANAPPTSERKEPPSELPEEILPEILPGPEEELPEIRSRDDEALPEIRPDPEPAFGGEAPKELPAADAAIGTGSHGATASRFLGSALEAMKAVTPTLDKYNKFALNLYMAGAIETLADRNRLGEAVESSMLKKALEALGTGGELAARFHEKIGSYMMEPRYMQIIQAGRNGMDTFLSGSESEAHSQLTGAFKEWNKPTGGEKKASIMTVMFTDMVGSTDLTQARGDIAAQEIVRRHNAIVRTALAQTAGKEVKHTGDGIMASFASSANAVEAAIIIQRQVAAHNERVPGQELHLRIGLNAGEPIQEEDDLFGTTVQLAARVCAATDTDQILCTGVVKELTLGSKSFTFRNSGEHKMKGFREAMTLWEAVWR